MKRTRPIKKYFITIPRVAISEPGVYQLKVKVSQVIIEKVKDLPRPQFPPDEEMSGGVRAAYPQKGGEE